jgi:hypothetical protein
MNINKAKKDINYFAKNVLDINLMPYQKELLNNLSDKNNKIIVFRHRRAGYNTINDVYEKFKKYIKDNK